MTTATETLRPWQLDLDDYYAAQTDICPPLEAACRFIHRLEWVVSVQRAALAGLDVPESRVLCSIENTPGGACLPALLKDRYPEAWKRYGAQGN